MNKEQEGLIELVGQEYTKWFYDNAVPSVSGKPILNGEGILTRGEFINKCKTDSEFSEKWGLKIEERELSFAERVVWVKNNSSTQQITLPQYIDDKFSLDEFFKPYGVPTRLITVTYRNQKIESYE
jgi:hypothetical protein